MTIREALAEGSAALKAAGIETAALDASLLLAGIIGVDRAVLIALGPDRLEERDLAIFHHRIERRLAGDCVAYITGSKEFRGLKFVVNPSVLVPRPDTETLVEAVLAVAGTGKQQRLLDLCTGSGAVAISLKSARPKLEVWATDISEEALRIARSNAARLLSVKAIRFLQGDLFAALASEQPAAPFTIIAANPPYIPSGAIGSLPPEVQAEPRIALDGGPDGLDIIRRIVAESPNFLSPGGCLLMEADPRQMGAIASLLEQRGFQEIQTINDLAGRERVIRGRKG